MPRTLYTCFFLLSSTWLACADPEAFASDHKTEIRYDCEQTIACRGGRGDRVSDDPVNDCISSSNKKLNDFSDDQRDVWEARFARCSPFQGCIYYDCTKADSTYSTAHAAELQYHCSAQVTCRNMRGEMLGGEAIGQCVSQEAVKLDIDPGPGRITFEQRFARCRALQGCAYFDCK